MGRTTGDLYQRVLEKRRYLESLGYNHLHMFESDFDRDIESTEEMKSFIEHLEIAPPPLQPREALFRRQNHADLMDMTKSKKENDGVQFVLLVIDISSKYLWMRPFKDKKGPTTAQAFEDKLRKGRRLRKLCTNKGQEF